MTFECLEDPVEGGRGVRKAGKGQGGLGYIRVGAEAVALPEGAARAAMEQSAEAAHPADVGQLFGGSCASAGRSVRGAHPEGGGGIWGWWGAGRRMCFALLSSSRTQARLDWS